VHGNNLVQHGAGRTQNRRRKAKTSTLSMRTGELAKLAVESPRAAKRQRRGCQDEQRARPERHTFAAPQGGRCTEARVAVEKQPHPGRSENHNDRASAKQQEYGSPDGKQGIPPVLDRTAAKTDGCIGNQRYEMTCNP